MLQRRTDPPFNVESLRVFAQSRPDHTILLLVGRPQSRFFH